MGKSTRREWGRKNEMPVIEKYNRRADGVNSLLCVGLDADTAKIPARFASAEFPQVEFNKFIIEQTHMYVAAYKTNSAFYEARGDRGLRELKMTVEYLRTAHPDVFTILDAKRADIASTSEKYAEFAFDWLGADAATLNPYMGEDGLTPFLERKDKACIILCRTSNPGAKEFQDLDCGGRSLWQVVAERVRDQWNKNSNCMLVAGATYPEELKALRAMMGDMTFLVPGVGLQGGEFETAVKAGLNAKRKGLIVNVSRGVIFADNPAAAAQEMRDWINACR